MKTKRQWYIEGVILYMETVVLTFMFSWLSVSKPLTFMPFGGLEFSIAPLALGIFILWAMYDFRRY